MNKNYVNKLAFPKIGFELRLFLRDLLQKSPEIIGPPSFCGPKASRKLPARFPALNCMQSQEELSYEHLLRAQKHKCHSCRNVWMSMTQGGLEVASWESYSFATGRIRFRRVRFQTPNSVSFSGLTEFRGASSVSSSQPIICVPKRTHRVFRRTHRVCPKTQ